MSPRHSANFDATSPSSATSVVQDTLPGIQFDGGDSLCSQMNQDSSCPAVTAEYGCTDAKMNVTRIVALLNVIDMAGDP
jgi:hypothetical protein